MNLTDTHCHFESENPNEIAAILERAGANGVRRVIAVGGSAALNAAAKIAGEISAADTSLPRVLPAFGLDRDQANCDYRPTDLTGACALGEIGLDYHYSPETRPAQMRLFAAQLERAVAVGLPVIVHTRDADDDTLALLRDSHAYGVIHCFTGTPEFARKLLDLGFYISISGIVTFRAAGNVRETAAMIPDERLLIETDSPYLAPVPMRGKSNEPAFLAHTCRFLAELRGTDAENLAELTSNNAIKAFNLAQF